MLPNVVVVHEAQSNIFGTDFIGNIDGALLHLASDTPSPQLVLTLGGSLTSRKIKAYLRDTDGVEHISIGHRPNSVDCFKHLAERIDADEVEAMRFLSDSIVVTAVQPSEFKRQWLDASRQGLGAMRRAAEHAPWCDLKAAEFVLRHLPESWHLQLSNGTAVR